jgi:DNA-3-methyladenine glycosylase II
LKPELVQSALVHLRRNDPVMKEVIRRVGPCGLQLRRDRFHMLVRSILSQQISGYAAQAIRGRLEALVAPQVLSAENLAALSVEQLRAVGVSTQKGQYLLSLATKVRDGELRLNAMGRLRDEAVIEQLVQVKGIGVWTAQMFLIFSLGRPDVLPCDDLGIRQAIRKLYGLNDMPDKATSLRIAESWRPYASIASWYCWRSLELPDEVVAERVEIVAVTGTGAAVKGKTVKGKAMKGSAAAVKGKAAGSRRQVAAAKSK